jgi:hypothetical protein
MFRSILTAAVAASALVANFIVIQLVNHFGIRTIFTICGLISAIGTCLLPTAIYSGYYFTLGCRILQGRPIIYFSFYDQQISGIAFAANFPAIG